MKRLILVLALLSGMHLQAQIQTLWSKSVADNSLPTWFSTAGNSERGFAYYKSGSTQMLLVVSRNNGLFIKKMDALTGADLGDMDLTGVTGGTYFLNDVGATYDGVIYASNLVIDSLGVFRIYRWSSATAAPTVAFESTFNANKRIGDNIYVTGHASDNSAEIWFADQKNNKIYTLGTSNNGVTFSIIRTIQLPAGTLGSAPSVCPIDGDEAVVVKSAGKPLTAWTYTGQFYADLPTTLIGTGATTVRIFGLEEQDGGFIGVFQYGVGLNNLRIVDTGDSTIWFKTYAITPSLGSNANTNGTGDFEMAYSPDGSSITLYVLGTNNGIGAYRFTTPYKMDGRFHEKYFGLADKQNNNNGFGANIDLLRVKYAVTNRVLYLAVGGFLPKNNADGIVLFLNCSNLSGTGAPAGTALGGITGAGHLFGATANPNFKVPFEVNYALAINTGGTDTLVYVDAVKYSGATRQFSSLGACKVARGPATGPAASGVFAANSVSFGYDTARVRNIGFEIAIPFDQIGNPQQLAYFGLLGAVASSTAYFSNITIPGNVSSGNLGFNPDFTTLPGGPYFTSGLLLNASNGTPSLPTEYWLSNNYPNPFNPSTGLSFSVPVSGNASVDVFNLAGERVASLFKGFAASGNTYALTFNAQSLPSGTYFCRLTAGGVSRITKMLLLK